MQIDLPVHQPPRDNKLLHRIDALLLHHQTVVLHIQHTDDAVGAHNALTHTREEAVASQIVESVHIQLAAHQLVQKVLWIAVVENADGSRESSLELLVQPLHKEAGAVLVVQVGNHIFRGVRKGSVTDVVQQYCQSGSQHLFGRHLDAFDGQHVQRTVHQIQRPQHVAEARVHRPWIHQTGESQLFDAPQPLEIGMRQHVVYYVVFDSQEPVVHWVVDNLPLISRHTILFDLQRYNFFLNYAVYA